jgi:serine/threonine-protein kinase
MGVVYEATHARLAGRYAIKVLLQNLADDAGALARFDREARITSSLQHPNIVQVIDHNTTPDGTSYLVMELLAGESLAGRLARCGPLPLTSVVEIVEQIAAGLTAAHLHGIVHRDLKPDNVFLVPVEGRRGELVKILDFGISRSGSGIHDIDRELCGTPEYMSPEQVEGTAEIAGATDQFALAVIAYELLTGRNPFKGDTLSETFAKVAAKEPPPTGVSPLVDAALARGFAKEKRRRFPTVTELAMALRDAATVTSGPAPDASSYDGEIVVVPGARRTPVRGRGMGWAVGLTIAISVATVGFFGGAGESIYSRPAAVESPPAAATAAPDATTVAAVAPAATAVAMDRPDAGPVVDRPAHVDGFTSSTGQPLVDAEPAVSIEPTRPPVRGAKRSVVRTRSPADERPSVPARPRTASPPPPDEDATLPLTES